MRPPFILCSLLLCTALPAFAQTARIAGVSEPPELSGEPKRVKKPSEADTQLFEIIGNLKDQDEVKSNLPKLDEFIRNHADYSVALFLRATCAACIMNSLDFTSIENDVKAAMSHPGQVYNNTDYYSLLGKIELARTNYAGAMDDLERAMRRDLDTANRMFNIEGVEPEKTSNFCTWNLADLDGLVARFPKDYRAWLFRGLYYEFFTTFKEDFYPQAMQNFQKASLLNPQSPLPPYFIGRLYSKGSWTKTASASDQGRDEQLRSAAQAYTKAIQLDSKFLPAYVHRADEHFSLKEFEQAIKDYNRVLTLDPDNASAYADRGLARLETHQYWNSISDIGEAIRLKNEEDPYLWHQYENRGDARAKLGEYRDAIADYTKAIELKFGQMTILLNLQQIRGLYPEYDQISDDVLLHKIHDLFWPNMEYAGFTKQLMEENGKWSITMLNELYEKRGDAYLKVGNFRRAVLDFARIFKGIPIFADSTDRWRALGRTANGEDYFLDVKSADLPNDGPVRLWIKMVGKKESQTVAYEVECKARRMETASTVTYGPNGKVLSSSEASSGWQRVVPDSVGEQLLNGACTATN